MGETIVHTLTRNHDVPERLFSSGLKLFANSLIEYNDRDEKEGEFKYYPPVLFTCWAAFEAFVKHSSTLLVVAAQELPMGVVNFLSEKEEFVNNKGDVAKRTRYYSVIDRYAVFMKYAYGFDVDRGEKYWQDLVRAKELRDYYTHLDVREPRTLSSSEVLGFVESLLLAIIVPSCRLRRTLLLGTYWLYDAWAVLHKHNFEYVERPFFFYWNMNDEYLFHCNFDNVDAVRFPTFHEKMLSGRKGVPDK